MKNKIFLFSMVVGISMVSTHLNSSQADEITQLMNESQALICTTTKNHPVVMQGYERFESHLVQGLSDGKFSLQDIHNIIKALNFAAEKHKIQTRKDAAKTPYIIHPMGVADSIMMIGNVYDAHILMGALLHDTVEDTNTTFEELNQTFGTTIEAYIREVTDDKSIPKIERKRMQVVHAPAASAGATVIKLADKLYNLNDIIQNPPPYWPIERRNEYFRWAQEVINGLPPINDALKKAIFDAVAVYSTQDTSTTIQKGASSPRRWDTVQNQLNSKAFEFINITIPKSGTHLLNKCIKLLQDKNVRNGHYKHKSEDGKKKCVKITKEFFIESQESRFLDRVVEKSRTSKNSSGKPPLSFHLAYNSQREQFVTRYTNSAFFMIRDPRDQLISLMNWVCDRSKVGTVDFDDMLLDLIDGKQRKEVYSVRMNDVCNMMWTFGLAEYYKFYLPWMTASSIYTVRFENLVGAQGGGSDELQAQEIRNIARHLQMAPLSDAKIKKIANNLFGKTNTFKSGQIGSWKRYFTQEHKAAFKQAAGQLLIDLGYEKDMNW